MRRKIILHGALKAIHPEPIEVVADTVAEALKIVTPQLPGFRPDAVNGRCRVQVSGCPTLESLFTPNDMEEIHLRPAFCGGKSGGFLEVIIGAVLIAASFVVPPISILSTTLNAFMFQAGLVMLLGGVLQLISAPKQQTSTKSHYLGVPENTTEIGTPIPILYGQRKVGGQFLSFNIASVDVGVYQTQST